MSRPKRRFSHRRRERRPSIEADDNPGSLVSLAVTRPADPAVAAPGGKVPKVADHQKRKLRRRIRERMARTGESYTTVRRNLLNPKTQRCYIFSEPIDSAGKGRDHVFPKNLFNVEDREDGLIIMPTHQRCNGSFSKDDDHFRLLITARAFPDAKARKLWNDPLLGQGQ